jgi:hypothetical protein
MPSIRCKQEEDWGEVEEEEEERGGARRSEEGGGEVELLYQASIDQSV